LILEFYRKKLCVEDPVNKRGRAGGTIIYTCIRKVVLLAYFVLKDWNLCGHITEKK